MKSISFSGVGLKFYKDKLEITTYDENYKNKECINNIQLYASEVCLDNEEKALGGVRFCTDSLLRNDEVTEIKGWAFLVDGNNKNTDVYIYSQGKFYLAKRKKGQTFLMLTEWMIQILDLIFVYLIKSTCIKYISKKMINYIKQR